MRQKSQVYLSFLIAVATALLSEYFAHEYKNMFSGINPDLLGFMSWNLKWHLVIVAVTLLYPILVYFLFGHHYCYREKLGTMMLRITVVYFIGLAIYWLFAIEFTGSKVLRYSIYGY